MTAKDLKLTHCIDLFFISVIFSTFLCASAKADDSAVDIAVLLKGLSNPYWKTLYDGVSDKAMQLGIKVYVQGVQSDSDAEGQLNLCNTMLLRKPKALVFGAVNNVNLAPCLRQAMQLGLKLVDVDGGMEQSDAEKIGIKLNFSVASDNYALGKKAAQYFAGRKGKVLAIEGFPGSVPGRLRIQGFRENLPAELEIVASLPGDWDRLKAADITNGIVTTHADLSGIFAANDLMALGAAEALHARNISGVQVVGIDGIADAVKAIGEGRLTASIAQLPYLMGQEAVEKSYKLINGHEAYEFNQKVPIVTLDKTILSAKNEPLLQFVR